MNKEVVVKHQTPPAVVQWGAREEINSDNFIIPKILPMQLTSQFVKDGKGQFGELRDSVTGALLAAPGQKLFFIPIELEEKWQIQHLEGKQWVFKEVLPYNNQNKKLAREETVNGVQMRRAHSMDFYVLLLDDINKGIDLPKTISFRSTSLRAGKVLYTQCYALNPRQGLSPAGMLMSLTTKRVDGDKGSYCVLEVAPVEKVDDSHVEAALKWYGIIKSGRAQVDEVDDA